jgi:hypothetical protein
LIRWPVAGSRLEIVGGAVRVGIALVVDQVGDTHFE